jgi:hypothetical protein
MDTSTTAVSLCFTLKPTMSSHPTKSAAPSDAPTVSSHPTTTSAPSASPTTSNEPSENPTVTSSVKFFQNYFDNIKMRNLNILLSL